jgi:hypothetical protein
MTTTSPATVTRPSGMPPCSAAGQPFDSAEEAWLWTAAALRARRDGARIAAGRGRVQRPCEPDDVVRCLDRLYTTRKVTLAHARILRVWGERQQAPDPRNAAERGDHAVWQDAMSLIAPSLRSRGVIG